MYPVGSPSILNLGCSRLEQKEKIAVSPASTSSSEGRIDSSLVPVVLVCQWTVLALDWVVRDVVVGGAEEEVGGEVEVELLASASDWVEELIMLGKMGVPVIIGSETRTMTVLEIVVPSCPVMALYSTVKRATNPL